MRQAKLRLRPKLAGESLRLQHRKDQSSSHVLAGPWLHLPYVGTGAQTTRLPLPRYQ